MIEAIHNRFLTRQNLFLPGVLSVLLLSTLCIRLINLNYNSASIDEAIYIMIGRLGLFQNDWWSYNPATWLAGLPYIYPTIAATTYMIGGIVGSRLFNIIVSVLLVEAVFNLTLTVFKTQKKSQKILAATIAALITGGASIGIVVSRLATYDIPSFYLFVLSLVFLFRSEEKQIKNGRTYFYAGIFLLLASLTKIIIGVYVPFVFLYSWFRAKEMGKKHTAFWFKYFAIPLIIGFGLYALTNLQAILAYADISATREKESFVNLFQAIFKHTQYVLAFFGIASIGMLLKKDGKTWGMFVILSLLVLLPHFLSQRAIWTMEKQTYLTISLLSPVIGIGIAYLIFYFKNLIYRIVLTCSVLLSLLGFWYISFQETQPYNTLWQDTRPLSKTLQANLLESDKILSESGAPFILDTYDYIYPLNVTTFDYFEYRGKTGDEAYVTAVKDGYFDVIQLNGTDSLGTSFTPLRGKIIQNLNGNYRAVVSEGNYVMYRRAF